MEPPPTSAIALTHQKTFPMRNADWVDLSEFLLESDFHVCLSSTSTDIENLPGFRSGKLSWMDATFLFLSSRKVLGSTHVKYQALSRSIHKNIKSQSPSLLSEF